MSKAKTPTNTPLSHKESTEEEDKEVEKLLASLP